MADELTSPTAFGLRPYEPMIPEPRYDARSLMRSLAFAYVGFPSAAAIMKPATDFGELVETGRMHDRARATWFKRKRHSKTVRRYAP